MATARELASRLAERAEDVCRHYLPNGRREGNRWRCGSTAGEPGRSLHVHLAGDRRGRWEDAAEPSDHGDLLDLIRAATGCATVREAMSEARRFLSLPPVEAPEGKPGAEQARPAPEPDRLARALGRAWPVADDDPGGRYLRSRGLDPADARLADIRFRPDAWAVVDGTRAELPALEAQVRRADGELTAVHRIFLTEDGTKSPVGRRSRGRLRDGAVWIPAGRIPRHVVLTEGVEDALSVVRVLTDPEREVTTVAAGLSASRVARVGLPPEAVSVTLIQDGDRAGEAAWEALRRAHRDGGLEAVRRIRCRGKDANEDLQALGPEGLRAVLAG